MRGRCVVEVRHEARVSLGIQRVITHARNHRGGEMRNRRVWGGSTGVKRASPKNI